LSFCARAVLPSLFVIAHVVVRAVAASLESDVPTVTVQLAVIKTTFSDVGVSIKVDLDFPPHADEPVLRVHLAPMDLLSMSKAIY
jgi:hypothetical protein